MPEAAGPPSSDTASPAAGRPMRADARRNNEALLGAARAAFAERGADVSLDDIARRAGVGSGTLYRHFPTRQALMEALAHDWIHALRDDVQRLGADDDPGAALVSWLRSFVGHTSTMRGLNAELMTSMGDAESPLQPSCRLMHEMLRTLVERAQEAGAIRADLRVEDLARLVNAIALAAESTPDCTGTVDRLLALTMDGLRAPVASA